MQTVTKLVSLFCVWLAVRGVGEILCMFSSTQYRNTIRLSPFAGFMLPQNEAKSVWCSGALK